MWDKRQPCSGGVGSKVGEGVASALLGGGLLGGVILGGGLTTMSPSSLAWANVHPQWGLAFVHVIT